MTRNDLRIDDLDPEYRWCRSKRDFASNAKARKWLRHSYRPIAGLRMRAYQCTLCKLWHLTSKPKQWRTSSMAKNTTDEDRLALRQAVRDFAKAQRLPIAAPDELIDLETEAMPQGQAQAELLVAYFDLRKRSTATFTVPSNEAALVLMVRDVIGHPENEHELLALNPRTGTAGRPTPEEQHRRIVDALLDGRFAEFLKSETELRREAIRAYREKREDANAAGGRGSQSFT